jgi:pheromone a factor receptor
MTDVPFTVFSLVALILCFPPAYFNWKLPYRPWATIIFIGWIALLNLLFFMESIIWRDPDPTKWWLGKGYCDISGRIKDMFELGIAGAAIGICRFLADATDPDPAHKDLQYTRGRRNMIDLFLGILLPTIVVGLKVICEVSRYAIAGVAGCNNVIDDSWVSIILYQMWCPLLVLIAAGYSGIFPPPPPYPP